MALTTNFSSASREQRWVDQISKKFIREVTIDISDGNPICVFNVPKSITAFKPEAYIPEVIALGPYHHMDPRLYHMERYKLAIAKSFFNQRYPQQENKKFQELLINKLKELDPIVRGCYHSYLDLDDNTLSWIVAIDGLFLLNFLQDYFVNLEGKKMQARDSILSRDLMLLENQIPLVILEEISKTIKYDSSEKIEDEVELLIMMETFCRTNSPLKLASISQCSYHATSHLHLLDFMYHLIVNNGLSDTLRSPQDEEEVANEDESEEIEVVEEDMNTIRDNISEITKIGLKFGIGGKILSPVQVIQDMPWDKILSILGLKPRDPSKHEGPIVEEIKIPSVSSLHYYAGITFRSTSRGIRDIKFVEEEAALYLPVITLDVNSEALFRNLVAYEIAMNCSHSSHSLSEFIDLVSGIIDDAEDARLLKQKGIIEGSLTNDQIAKLFNGMNKSTKNSKNKTVSKINNYYKKRLVVKLFKFMKTKLFSSLKVITSLSTVLLLMLLLLYSFCKFYGCSKLFGGSSSS
ncbi:putative UPF0481 protein At3g02645 [Cynara cardunculus var. scolymus]|uniref:putative UPF0481 protein At3g02645 n=1 Tax=Cynara cardunculus var. scolymus TaxID=59895 RepID=UPI000D631510|nr:putative UPF0481 protein At3g02645 [Cynara cardunculus var. scolymus]